MFFAHRAQKTFASNVFKMRSSGKVVSCWLLVTSSENFLRGEPTLLQKTNNQQQTHSRSIYPHASVWKKTVADWKSVFIMGIECLYLGSRKRLWYLSFQMIDPQALFNH
jgi:hypothetical protein